MKTDALFYRLFESKPETFFLVLGQPAAMAADFDFLALEYKETAARADGVFRPKKSGLPVYFTEVQFYRKPEIYADLLVKVGHYLKYIDPTKEYRGVVLFATRSLEPRDLIPYQPLLDAGYFRAIYLDELPDLPNAPLGLSILHLIRKSEQEAPENARRLIVQTKMEIGDESTRRELVELIETVVLYKLPKLSREEIQAMLQVDDIRETRVYKDAKAEARVETQVENIARMARKKASPQEIAELLGLDLDFVIQEIAKIQSNNPSS